MAELIGGALLSAFLEVLVDRLASQDVIDFFRGKKPIAEQLEKLNIMLCSANALLNDAEDKQVKDANVKSWVDNLSQVFHEADDVVDEIKTEALRLKIEDDHDREPPRRGRRTIKLLRKLIPTPFSAFDRATSQKIEKIMEVLRLLLEAKRSLGLKEGVQSRRLERLPAPLIGDPSDVYGRDGDKEAVIGLLLSDVDEGDKISVIPIVGMAGIGKTTLARLVYDDSRLKARFEHRVWVTVSDDFDVFRLSKLVFEGLTSQKCDVEELDQLRDKLEDAMRGKKFLLVMDDVWNESYDHWFVLKSYFQFGVNGSKIIVTTRSEIVASKMGSVPSYPLREMSDGDCWKLFIKHAFHNVEPSECRDLEEIGIQIVKKCKGLPLAVRSLAGLLRSVSNPKEWQKILKSDVWELHKDGNDKILPALWLSYSYLPSHLKRCFSYCSIFPKDYKYKKEEIVLLWMAEGLLQGENMEDAGEEYLEALISRSLFQRSSKDGSTFLMHDLVHDLAIFVSGKGFCIKMANNSNIHNLTDKTRHLSLEGQLADSKSFKALSKASSLHTFLAWSSALSSFVFQETHDALLRKCRCLRVLCLSKSSIGEVPYSIGKLKHLRYLDLSGTDIKMLPDTICTLYNLQTLLLYDCTSLSWLPADMDNLINLRHLDISNTHSLNMMPKQIWNLKRLRTLPKFVLNDKHSGSRIKELRELPHLRGRLEVSGLKNIVHVKDVSDAGFKDKRFITELSFDWSAENVASQIKERAILDALQPHVNLKKLFISWYGGITFSDWVADESFSNTTEVNLSDCKHCCVLPPFGQLPSLKKLTMTRFKSVETISSEFYGSATVPFRSLQSLCFEEMHEWRHWSFDGGSELEARAFPCLEKLSLTNCWKLKSSLPDSLPSLKILKLVWCQRIEVLLPTIRLMSTAFPSLESMHIRDCPELQFSGWPLPSSLESLSISGCEKIFSHRTIWNLQRLASLKELRMEYCKDIVDSFPEEGLLPTTLTDLYIYDAPNLKALNGKSLQQLTSLERLTICYCWELQCLPEERLPASLSYLYVSKCPLLEPRLQRRIGEDWDKISHIPRIYISERRI